MADQDRPDQMDQERRRASELEDRSVLGAAPVSGGPTMASSGAFDTVGGGDLGAPGSRDPGDATSQLRDPSDQRGDPGGANEQQDQRRTQGLAQGGGDASDAQGLSDDRRAQDDAGSANNNDSL
jgi:hypothetical protein